MASFTNKLNFRIYVYIYISVHLFERAGNLSQEGNGKRARVNRESGRCREKVGARGREAERMIDME